MMCIKPFANFRPWVFGAFALLGVGILASEMAMAAGPYQATGIKVGEMTDSSALVWTRLTLRPERNPSDGPTVTIQYAQRGDGSGRRTQAVEAIVYENNVSIGDVRESVPGTDGDVRVLHRKRGSTEWTESEWKPVRGLRDFTAQFRLTELDPGTHYDVKVESRSITGEAGQTVEGRFVTAPAAETPARVVFTVSTGQGNDDQDRPDGFNIYPEMLKLDPSFFVHTGDIIYYDSLAKTVELARYHWQRMYSWPTNVEFHRFVGSYFERDDHDTWVNDCWPTMQMLYMHEFTFRQGQQIFNEQVPMGGRTWRTRRWGKDLQIWMVEGRDFRSPNTMPDGPEKTIWGDQQKRWFKRTVRASDATFRILISPTPLIGPDRQNKHDNHSNADFAHEGNELREFLAAQNMVVICGDRHWQYVSVDPKTGLKEFSCGPASDQHAGGWSQEDNFPDYHKYLNVIGGFLAVTVDRVDGKPTAIFRHHDARGNVVNEDRLSAE